MGIRDEIRKILEMRLEKYFANIVKNFRKCLYFKIK